MPRRSPAIGIRCLAAIQLALGLAVLAAALALPAPGEAALYLPLGGGVARAVSFAARENTTILARGPIAGSIVLRAPSRSFAFAALADRALVIAAPAVGCTAQKSNRT